MGTPDFSVPVLEALIKEHEVIAVVTQHDKPKGRGKNVISPPVKQCAQAHKIFIYQPVKVKEESFIEELKALQPDVIVVVAFGQILPKTVLDLPKYGCINVHASLLPKLRGAAPIQWAVINGEKKSGVTTMYMDTGLDTGDMLLKSEVVLEKEETGGSLHDKLSKAGADLLLETLKRLKDHTIVREKQDDSQSSYVGMLTKATGKLDFSKSAIELERLIRGLNPWPSAYTSLHGKTLKIWSAYVLEEEVKGKLGEIVEITKDCFMIQTKKGLLAVTQLQMEGKKRMSTSDFLRGYHLEKGTILE